LLASVITEHGVFHMTADAPTATFGRDPSADVKVGHAPKVDSMVPRLAGSFSFLDGRILVTNRGERLAYTVWPLDGALVDLRPGQMFGPETASFDVTIDGRFTHIWRVTLEDPQSVRALRGGPGGRSSPDQTDVVVPDLTDRQQEILNLYTEPLRKGGTIPRTHREVGRQINLSRQTVILELYSIWDRFDAAGVPMRTLSDKRDEVVNAWMRHYLHPKTA
jgi:hypothetical protein